MRERCPMDTGPRTAQRGTGALVGEVAPPESNPDSRRAAFLAAVAGAFDLEVAANRGKFAHRRGFAGALATCRDAIARGDADAAAAAGVRLGLLAGLDDGSSAPRLYQVAEQLLRERGIGLPARSVWAALRVQGFRGGSHELHWPTRSGRLRTTRWHQFQKRLSQIRARLRREKKSPHFEQMRNSTSPSSATLPRTSTTTAAESA